MVSGLPKCEKQLSGQCVPIWWAAMLIINIMNYAEEMDNISVRLELIQRAITLVENNMLTGGWTNGQPNQAIP